MPETSTTPVQPSMRRRTFLGLTGAAAGVALLEGCAKQETQLIEQTLRRSSTAPGEAAWRRSICGQCGGGCELTVRTIDGRAKKIEGDATAALSHGGVCALGHSALQELYSPHRFLVPMQQSGTGEPTPSTWEEALEDLADPLSSASTRSSLAICCGEDPVERALCERIASALGASVTVVEDSAAAVERAARRTVYGADVDLQYALEGADFVLAAAASILDRWGNPVAQAHAVAERQARGGVFAVVGERMSLSAAKADLHLPAIGGYGALYDVVRMAYEGQDDPGVAAAAERYGIEPSQIEALVHGLKAADRPVIVVGGEGQTVADVVAGYRLQAAVGAAPEAVDVTTLLRTALGDNSTGSAGTEQQAPDSGLLALTLADLVDAVKAGTVETIVTVGVDLVGTVPDSWGLTNALSNTTLVALATEPDASTSAADWVLPLQCDLERVTARLGPYGEDSALTLALADPVVRARGEARHPIDILLALHQSVVPESDRLIWKDASEARAAVVAAVAELEGKSARGALSGALRGSGRLVLEAGGATTVTPDFTGLASSAAASTSDDGETTTRLLLFEGVRGERHGWLRPWLKELPDPMSSVMWGSWVELSVHDAESKGIKTGDLVDVVSGPRSVRTTAFVQPALRPGVAAMPVGGFEPALDGHGDARNLLDIGSEAGVPLQTVAVSIAKSSDAGAGAPIFGRGLKTAEQIPAGWEHHDTSKEALVGLGASGGTESGTDGEAEP